MDAGDWIALASAVVAIGSMCVALWQAREARESRHAAQTQAAAAKESAEIAAAGVVQARRSAKAAEAQAVAATEQAEIGRQQIELMELDRHRRDAPRFEITWRPTMGSYGGYDNFMLSYTSGPEILDEVTIEPAPGSDILGLTIDVERPPEEQSIYVTSLACGVTREFRAAVGLGTSVVFYVSAKSGSRSWGPVSILALSRNVPQRRE